MANPTPLPIPPPGPDGAAGTTVAPAPTPPEQELLDYTRGAGLGLSSLISLYVDIGALAAMNERQAVTIAALQLENDRLRAVIASMQARFRDLLGAALDQSPAPPATAPPGSTESAGEAGGG